MARPLKSKDAIASDTAIGYRLTLIRENKKTKSGNPPRDGEPETQKQLADFLNVSRNTVQKYECGETPIPISTLKEITEHYNVSSDYLLGLTTVIKPDVEKQAICKLLGLNEKAVDNISEISNQYLNDEIKEQTELYSWDVKSCESINKALNLFFSCESFEQFATNLGFLYETSTKRNAEEKKYKTDTFSPDDFSKSDITFKCAKLELQESFEQVRNELLEEVEKSVSGGKENAKHKKSK